MVVILACGIIPLAGLLAGCTLLLVDGLASLGQALLHRVPVHNNVSYAVVS